MSKKGTKIFTKVLKGLLKIGLATTLFLFLLFFILAGALQVPKVQNYVVDKVMAEAEKITGYKVTVGGIHIDWFDIVVLEEVALWDDHRQKMINLGEAEVDYTILSLLKGSVNLDNITLRDGSVNLVRYIGSEYINISEFIWKIQELTTPKVKRVGPPQAIVLPKFTLDNMLFSYNDLREEVIKDKYFDYNHFTLDSIHGTVTNFYAVLDTIMLDAHKLRVGLRESHLKIHELSTSFLLDKHQIRCSNLYARVADSELNDYFRFGYNDINDLTDFNEKADITIHSHNARVAIRDVAHFAPALKGIDDVVTISGKMKGRVNRFHLDSIVAQFGKSSKIAGVMRFDGLPTISETFMDIDLKKIDVVSKDIELYSGRISNDMLRKFGRIKGKGEFLGFVSDFALKTALTTDIGYLSSDVRLDIDENDSKHTLYDGNIATIGFDLGRFTGQPLLQKIDMKGKLSGAGFTLNDAKLELDASISRLGINQYDYKNITTDATLSESFFDGNLVVNDTNLVLKMNGKIDMEKQPEVFDIVGSIAKANLEKLNITGYASQLITDFDLDFKGTDIDSIVGMASLSNTYLRYKEKDMMFNKLYLNIAKQESLRIVNFDSDMLDVDLSGNFYLTELAYDANVLYNEMLLFYDQDFNKIKDYYKTKKSKARRKYTTDIGIHLKDINGLLDLYSPGIYIANNTKLNGEFASGISSRASLAGTIDTIFYKGNEFYKNNLDISIAKLTDSSTVLAMGYVTSEKQNFKNTYKTEKFYFDGHWSDSLISFTTSIAQQGNLNKLFLNGDMAIRDRYKALTFTKSYLDILDERWNISDTNSIFFTNKTIRFNTFKLSNKEQSLAIKGDLSDDADKQANFQVKNFSLQNLNPLIHYKLGGVANGLIKIKNIYRSLDMGGLLQVEGLSVDEFLFGNLRSVVDWNEKLQHLNLLVDVMKGNTKVINLSGNIKPSTTTEAEIINLVATLNSTDLAIISPILKGVMSDVSGSVNGKLDITGSFNDLRLKGEAMVEKGRFKLDYLQSPYTFSDKIYFTEDVIRFRNLVLTDMNGSKAKLNGGIYYDGFKNFLVDIKGDYKNFNVLNTTENDNGLFYGNANVTGNFSVFGPFNNLEIKANAKSEKDTRIYIPLTGDSEVSKKEYITFLTEKNAEDAPKKKDSIDVSGINMIFNMDITPDAYTEIIFDKRSGDIIRGKGEGNIELRYDTRGDMTMFGNYTIREGWYNFTMASIISKEFVIDPGSKLSWNGDPYDGLLDIKAKYHQFTSLKPIIVDSSLRAKPDMQRSYPTDVVLGVSGSLLAPEISMDIDILRYPSDPTVSTLITDFEARIKNNDQELNKQVFSLIMLNRFSEPNSFSGVSSGGTSNVSELLSSQLSNFLSQVDQNLEVDVNLRNLDRNALNTFRLRLSYTMMDGRLRITRDGNFQNVQASQQANISNIAGEWTVEYLLSEEGNFRMKLFNRINNNSLLASLNSTTTSAGFSFMHTQSFNNLKELFGRRKRRKEEEENFVPIDTLR